MKTNVILIGMPAAGKSTVGVLLAKHLSMSFLDTDVLIQVRENRGLQDIVDREGYLALRRIEERELLALDVRNHVVATGGSAAYSEPAMRHLQAHGTVVFLDVDLETLRTRIGDFTQRGLAKRLDQTFEELFYERRPLYERYANIRIACGGLTHDALCRRIEMSLRSENALMPPYC